MFREILTSFLEKIGRAAWIEIVTEHPRCTYYFGPFFDESEAAAAQDGFVEDLESEGATGIVCVIKRCNPEELTIYDEIADVRVERITQVHQLSS
ncbi:MAG: DUF1816 domain-containing protein [Oscillatoriales cyanobacterium SM2_2_1]|nr:DUF1816 domain-containing protein [Oscillatoriales cyanobacterium SM2_2_1]